MREKVGSPWPSGRTAEGGRLRAAARLHSLAIGLDPPPRGRGGEGGRGGESGVRGVVVQASMYRQALPSLPPRPRPPRPPSSSAAVIVIPRTSRQPPCSPSILSISASVIFALATPSAPFPTHGLLSSLLLSCGHHAARRLSLCERFGHAIGCIAPNDNAEVQLRRRCGDRPHPSRYRFAYSSLHPVLDTWSPPLRCFTLLAPEPSFREPSTCFKLSGFLLIKRHPTAHLGEQQKKRPTKQ